MRAFLRFVIFAMTHRSCLPAGVDYDAANVVVTYTQRFALRDRRADPDFLVRGGYLVDIFG